MAQRAVNHDQGTKAFVNAASPLMLRSAIHVSNSPTITMMAVADTTGNHWFCYAYMRAYSLSVPPHRMRYNPVLRRE